MVVQVLRRLACLVLALALPVAAATSAAPVTAAMPANPFRIALADDAGEPCASMLADDSRRDSTLPPVLAFTCNGNPASVGVLRPSALPLDIAATGARRRQAIEAAARRSLAAAEFARRMDCPAGQWVTLASGSEVLVALCTMREGNWPQLMLTYAEGRVLYQAAGLPVMLPVLSRAIAGESGKPFELPAEFHDRQRLGARLGGAIVGCTALDFATADAALRQARVQNSRGDFASAEGAYRSALEIQARVFGPDSLGAGEVAMALALEVSNQQRFDEAASLFRRADPVIERSTGDFQRARLLAYKALDAANRSRYEEALQFARAASTLRRRSIDRTSDFADDAGRLSAQSVSKGELLHSLMIEAQMLLRLDDLASAEAAAGEALDIVVHTDGLPLWWRPNVLAFLGDLNERQGRLAVAERQQLDALRLRQRIFGESGPTALSQLALGRLYGAQDARAPSLAAYHVAFDILDRERATRAGTSFNQIEPFFRVATAAGPSPEIDAEIVRAIQLTGASVTDQTIERSANRLGAADPVIAEMLRQAEAARRQLTALRISYAEATDLPAQMRDARQEAALASAVVAAQSAATEADQRLRRDYPSYSNLATPGAVSLPVLRAHLAPDEAVVTFALGAQQSWVVMIRADQIVARPIAVTEDSITAQVATLRRAFVPRLGKLVPFDLQLAHALHDQLLGPVAGQLTGIHHIVFVAHGPLASLPLAVLVAGAGENSAPESYREADWLIRHYAVSQVPTLASLVALREAGQHHKPPPLPFLGFAAPDFLGRPHVSRGTGGSDALTALAGQCRENRPISSELLRALEPLPESREEAEIVARQLGAGPGMVHTGVDASEAVLRQQPLDQFGVLYFATHGLLPGELRCQAEPGLALSPPATIPATRAQDGLLDASEIAAFRLNTDLVVLSACNTAEGGGRFGGDALSGMAEAFFYAGARGVIASHWQVPSKATVALMTGMFGRVRANGTAEALRQSQLALIDQAETAHPFNWAAFTLIGDGLTAGARVAEK